ncbi:hypothetical protein VPH35_129388 [Triticum aestivum]
MPCTGHGLSSPHREAAAPCTGRGRSPAFPVGPWPHHHMPGDSGRGHRLTVVMVCGFVEVAAYACRLWSSGALLLDPPLLRRTSTCRASEVEAEPSDKGTPMHRMLWSARRLTATFGSVIASRDFCLVRARESLPLGSFSAGVRAAAVAGANRTNQGLRSSNS